MPRIRSIHPDACESHTLARLSNRAERTWWRLLPNTDDHGRGRFDPVTLRSKLYTASPHVTVDDIANDLAELHQAGLVVVYRNGGRTYYLVRSWGEYQKPKHQAESRHPGPTDTGSERIEPDPDPTGEDSDPTDPTELEGEGEKEGESSLSDPGQAGDGADGESDADDPSTEARIVESFEEFWTAYPDRDGKKIGKQNALIEWRKLGWDQRRRAYIGAVNLAASDHLPKDPERFLRRSKGGKGDYPFDDWQEPATPGTNGRSKGAHYATLYDQAAQRAMAEGR